MVILGGAGTILGPVIGALVFQFIFFTFDALMATAQSDVDFIGSILSPAEAGQLKLVLLGVGLILLMVFRPQGILGDPDEVTLDGR
jgi:branched-chain amino acid transport system permease protein